MKQKILLVDDHQMMRDGIRAIVGSSFEFKIVAEASDGEEALNYLKNNTVDLVVLDINMPNMDGVACAKSIKANCPRTKILAISMYVDDLHVMKMHEAGANGYISKDAGKKVFIEAMQAISRGESYHSKEVKQIILSHFVKTKAERMKDNPYHFLTSRELVILKLIVEEKSNIQIAEELSISIRTVDSHRRNIIKKTGASGAVGLTKFALKHGIGSAS